MRITIVYDCGLLNNDHLIKCYSIPKRVLSNVRDGFVGYAVYLLVKKLCIYQLKKPTMHRTNSNLCSQVFYLYYSKNGTEGTRQIVSVTSG